MGRKPKIILIIAFVISSYCRIANAQVVTYTSPIIIKSLAANGNDLWIGGMGCLTRLDLVTGNKTVYTTANTPILANDIDAIFVDNTGNIWVSCAYDGREIFRYDGNQWKPYYLNINNVGYSASTVFHQDPLNRVVALTPDNNNLLFFDSTSTLSFSLSQLTASPSDFDIDSLGHIWISTNSGIFYYDSTNWTTYFPQSRFDRIKIDKKGNVWAAFNDNPVYQIYRFDGVSWTIDSSGFAQTAGSGDILIDNDNNKLFYNLSGPVLLYNDTSWSYASGNWCTGQPIAMTIDTGGTIYSATYWNDSVTIFSNNNCTTLTTTDFSYTDIYFETVENGPDNKIYAGTMHGIYQFDGVTKNRIATPSTNEYFRKIRFDHNGLLWAISYASQVGNYHLASWDGSLWTVFPYTYDFEDMDIAPNGDIWFGTSNGLLKYDGVNFTNIPFTSPTTTNPMVRSVAIDTSGNVWFSVSGSFAKYDGTNFTWYQPSNTPYNLDGYILRADKEGNVFTNSGQWNNPGGLVKYDGGNFIQYNSSNSNWPDSCYFYSMREDNLGNVWFGTSRGIVRYDGVDFIFIENISNHLGCYQTYDLAIDNMGNIWCANFNNLSVFNYYDNGQFEIEPKNRVTGVEFLDVNSNGIFDSTEVGVPYHLVSLQPGNTFQLTNYLGKYTLYTDSGNCEVSYQPVPNYILTSDSAIYHVIADSAVNCCYDFGIAPSSVIHDGGIDLISMPMRCNRPSTQWLNITNTGTVNDDFIVWMKCDSLTLFNYATISPSSFSGDTIFWNISNLPPFGILLIGVNLSMANPQLITGTIFSFSCSLADVSNTTVYDVDSISVPFTCSMDPNEKSVAPVGDSVFHAVPASEWLEYTIHFQNVGNDTAISVFIYDTLDANLDLSTFTFVASSHHPVVKYDSNGNARFAFYNIMLPDSHVNYIASEGFIRYRIKPKNTTPDSTRIENSAAIFFDFNNPIRTNTVFNIILNPSAGIIQQQETIDEIAIYPNPLSDNELKIDTRFTPEIQPELYLYDLSGRIVYSVILQMKKNNSLVLPIMEDGIYMIRVRTGKKCFTKKLVIIKQ